MASNGELEAAKKGVREALSIYQTSCGWELVDAIAVHALEAAERVRVEERITNCQHTTRSGRLDGDTMQWWCATCFKSWTETWGGAWGAHG